MLSSPASKKPGKHLREARVGVHVDGPPVRLPADEANGRLDDMGREERIPLASLAEAHHGAVDPADVGQGHLRDLLGGGGEIDALLAAGDPSLRLEGDASQASGVAGPGGGQGGLVPAQEEVLSGRASIFEGAAFEVPAETVVGHLPPHPEDPLHHLLPGHPPEVLAGLAVHADHG